jgi:hypothetical protein
MERPTITIELYRIDSTTGEFTKFEDVTTYLNLTWYDKENGIGAASFALSIFDQKARLENFRKWRTIVAIKENDTIVWVGVVTDRTINYQDVSGYITVQCSHYIAMLTHRYTPSIDIHNNQDIGDIAADLIAATQNRTNGELGIVKGSVETSRNLNITYEYTEVFSAIANLTNIPGGFDIVWDYNVDALNQLDEVEYNIYKNSGRRINNIPPLQLGRNVNEIVSIDTQDEIYNAIIGLGSGTGGNVITISEEDTASQKSYTRREKILARKDLSIEEVLETVTEDELNTYKVERLHINIDMIPEMPPLLGQIKIGDIVPIKLKTDNESFVNFVGTAKIIEAGKTIQGDSIVTNLKLEYIP